MLLTCWTPYVWVCLSRFFSIVRVVYSQKVCHRDLEFASLEFFNVFMLSFGLCVSEEQAWRKKCRQCYRHQWICQRTIPYARAWSSTSKGLKNRWKSFTAAYSQLYSHYGQLTFCVRMLFMVQLIDLWHEAEHPYIPCQLGGFQGGAHGYGDLVKWVRIHVCLCAIKHVREKGQTVWLLLGAVWGEQYETRESPGKGRDFWNQKTLKMS